MSVVGNMMRRQDILRVGLLLEPNGKIYRRTSNVLYVTWEKINFLKNNIERTNPWLIWPENE